jgi:hypothetical protein
VPERILISANRTLAVLENKPSAFASIFASLSDLGLTFLPDHRGAQKAAFVHLLQTFESSIQSLDHLNAAADGSLLVLDNHIHVVGHVVGEETGVRSREVGDILGRLWTILGGNRSLLNQAQLRFAALLQAGVQVKRMKSLVWDARVELNALGERAEILRSYAVEPLLLGGPIQQADIVRIISQGSKSLLQAIEDGTMVAKRVTLDMK